MPMILRSMGFSASIIVVFTDFHNLRSCLIIASSGGSYPQSVSSKKFESFQKQVGNFGTDFTVHAKISDLGFNQGCSLVLPRLLVRRRIPVRWFRHTLWWVYHYYHWWVLIVLEVNDNLGNFGWF